MVLHIIITHYYCDAVMLICVNLIDVWLAELLQDKVALLASNGRFLSAPEDGGRVYCLSETAGDREMIQVTVFKCFLLFCLRH